MHIKMVRDDLYFIGAAHTLHTDNVCPIIQFIIQFTKVLSFIAVKNLRLFILNFLIFNFCAQYFRFPNIYISPESSAAETCFDLTSFSKLAMSNAIK